jgi:hypothetical protein
MTNTDMHAAAERLRANLANLQPRDVAFAGSLLDQLGRRGLSDKQIHWLGVLADRATAPVEQPAAAKVADDLSPVLALFKRAVEGGKRPAITFDTAEAGRLRISLAGERSREPGTLMVTDGGGFDATFFGRVRLDGSYVESRNRPDMQPAVRALLTRFAADPAGVASEEGRRTGMCCFCARDLTDERSVAAGFGPRCADRFGLSDAWGNAVRDTRRAA